MSHTLEREIKFVVHAGDIRQVEADVLALKYARGSYDAAGHKYVKGLFGVDKIAAEALNKTEKDMIDLLPALGTSHLFPGQGKIKAKQVFFLNVGPLSSFTYKAIYKFCFDVLKELRHKAPATSHVAVTLHGMGYGMSAGKVLRSELNGFIEGLETGEFPPSLEKITVVDLNPDVVEKLQAVLSGALPKQKMSVRLPSEHNVPVKPGEPDKIDLSEAHYDVFLSYKSEDSEYARKVYDLLKGRDLNVFFSKKSLPKLGSDEYHEQIDLAIENARHMVVVTESRDHVLSQWVKYEWRLFLGEKLAGRKQGNLITVIAGDMRIQDLPISLRNREVVRFSPGEIKSILGYVKKDDEDERN
jgi:hypothetical protein